MPSLKKDLIIVGAGIIGATIAKWAESQGMSVLLLDDNRANSGTKPSGGHLKPSWMGGMNKDQYEPAMELLDSVWGLKEEQFTVWPTNLKTTVWRVDTDQVVNHPHKPYKVINVFPNGDSPRVEYLPKLVGSSVVEECKFLVVAAGVWCSQLLPGITTQSKQGVSFRMSGALSEAFIKPWAPYKQVVAHQQAPNEIWIGDGTAVLDKNWKKERTLQCFKRCQQALKLPQSQLLKQNIGYRPYCKLVGSNPCLFEQVGPHAYVVTGAGKMGTIAAGWAAGRIGELCQ